MSEDTQSHAPPGDGACRACQLRADAVPAALQDHTPSLIGPGEMAEIERDLLAVPAPPWRWIGHKDTGPMLVTDHSGQLYLLGPAHPGAEDDEMRPIYGDLQFRDKRPGEKYALMRRAAEMIVPRADHDPDAYSDIDNPMARWLKVSAQHVSRLAAAYRELSASAAVEISTRQDRIAELETALRAALAQRDLQAEYFVQANKIAHRVMDERDRLRCERDELLGQVWSTAEPPGGYVCSHPMPEGGPGIDHDGARICGTPVESEPCPEHSPEGLRVLLAAAEAERDRRAARITEARRALGMATLDCPCTASKRDDGESSG